jgi:hypothetical protein
LDAGDDLIFQALMDDLTTKRLKDLRTAFVTIKGISKEEISISTLFRTQTRLDYTFKTLTRLNSRQDPVEAINFLASVAHVHESMILNIDASNTGSGENLKANFGRSKKGQPAIKREFIFRGEPCAL